MTHHAHMTTLTSIELFAGAGGMALGLEMAGFTCKGLVEFDKHACNTLRANRPEWNVIERDINELADLSVQELKSLFNITEELDLIAGGSPCQAFSYAGKKLGLEDTRGTLFYPYATLVGKLKPKVFLFENVRGLLSHDKGRTFSLIREVFQEQGYTLSYKILNAWDYGVAQKRERLILIGIRKDINKSFTFPLQHEYKPVLKDVLQNVPDSPCEKYSQAKAKAFSHIPAGGNWTSVDINLIRDYVGKSYHAKGGNRGVLRRLSWDEPCLTVLCRPSAKITDRCHPDEIRPFTVRESARIQSFPDTWEFTGPVGSQYRQIGNAVPVLLAKEVGNQIKKLLEEQ